MDGSDVGPITAELPQVMLEGVRLLRKVSPGLTRLRPCGEVDATLVKGLWMLARLDVRAVLARRNNLLSGEVDKLRGSPSERWSFGVLVGGVSPQE